jgi:hypothetical protein
MSGGKRFPFPLNWKLGISSKEEKIRRVENVEYFASLLGKDKIMPRAI